MDWNSVQEINCHVFTCGFCGCKVASDKGYYHTKKPLRVHICPNCDLPSIFDPEKQIPGVAPGDQVKHLPEQVEALYEEARRCAAASCYTAAVLTSRKLLMNIAVAQGAKEGHKFLEYIEYLAQSGYIPPKGRDWVDHIRKKGNEATHEIVLMDINDAEEIISFAEMLLKFVYEFPNRLRERHK